MKVSKISLCFLALTALLAGVFFVSPATAEEWGFDFWHIGEFEAQLANCENRRAEMEKADQVIVGRTSLRQGIISNLCSKRITLDEAASGFMTLNQTEPASINYLRMTHANRSDHELAVIQVMMFIFNYYGRHSEEYERIRCEAISICGPNFD